MPQVLGPEEKALRRAVSEVLHYVWDPIGVAGSVHARDEYESYVAPVCALLWEGAGEEKISAALVGLARESMGLEGSEAASARAARKLIEWRSAVTR